MKKILSTFLIAVMCLLSFCVPTFAEANVEFSTQYLNDTKVLRLSGTTALAENDMAIALIYSYSGGIDETSPALADAFLLGEGGVIAKDIILPTSLAGGKYVIRLSTPDGYKDVSFMHIDDTLANAALGVINAASSESFEAVLAEKGPDCGLDPDLYAEYRTKISPVLYSYKPAGGFGSVDSFLKLSKQAIAAAYIMSGENIDEVFAEFNSYLTELDEDEEVIIDVLSDYNLLSDRVREDLDAELLSTNFADSKGFCRIFRELAILTQFEKAENWAGVKDVVLGTKDGDVILNNFDILDPDKSDYNRLKDKDEVFRSMYKNRSGVSDFDDIADLFEDMAEDCLDEENNPSKGSGGSGGGGGGKNVSISTSGIATVTPSLVAGENTSVILSDISGHWGENSISTLVRKNIISGYTDGTFKPDAFVTRAEFVTMLVKAFNISGDASVNFNDVAPEFWGYNNIKNAVACGIITGYEDGSFKPNEIINREQVAVMMHRALSLKMTIPEGSSNFLDVAEISDYALRSVLDLAGLKLINGTGDHLYTPKIQASRAMAATLINNVIEFLEAR